MQRKSTIAFLMALPLILLIVLLVLYPALYSIHLATLNKSMERFVGLRQLPVPVQARNVLDGGAAVLHLRHHGGGLQSHHRLLRRALRAQHSGQGPAQVARHAAGAVGDPARHEHARVAVAVRPVLQRLQLDLRAVRHRAGPVDRRRLLGALLGHPGQRLDRRAVLHDHVSGGAQIGARAALRGRRDRRRQLVAAHVVRDACR